MIRNLPAAVKYTSKAWGRRLYAMAWLLALSLATVAFFSPGTVAGTVSGSVHWTRDLALKHRWTEPPNGWAFHGIPPKDQIISLRIGLKQGKIDDLIATLKEVSDPDHPSYRQHLSREDAEALIAPHPRSVDLVHEWLSSHNIDIESQVTRSSAGDWLSVAVPISKAESMLAATYHNYRHENSELIVRSLSYSLPRELHKAVDIVGPTTMFDGLRKMKATYRVLEDQPVALDANAPDVMGPAGQSVPASCNTTITPSCLQALYRTANYTPTAADSGNQIGVTGYLEQFVNFADLQMFFGKFSPEALGANVTVFLVDGGLNNQSVPGTEANLDCQYTGSLTFPTPNVYYSTPGTAPTINDSVTPPERDEPYLDWLNFVLSHDNIPQTFTTSYGGDEQTFPVEFAKRVCDTFAQLGARGSSVLFSSGDGGVGESTCVTNDGTNRTLFQPVFPATCPYVTGVGATFHIAPKQGIEFSGGGFSRVFERPAFQDKAVPPFLAGLGETYAGLFNPSGRGVPDISAQGEGFQIIVDGRQLSVGGTSASSPTVASVVSLLNDHLISTGKRPLGWLNPFLYSKGTAGLTDVLLGNNPGCNTTGFSAVKGWDPITGLGTPDFVKLKALVV